ncbi:intraflagellar transport protein 52 homolog [Schistocerca americana]|uniref:intraflagellar transport protein 52 homolog n=1 Tax=Schistocerca americana TaxID=7009 RepID=UPI001F4F57BF|nr:intraflagellar transport protein 52 homolog [Schistocerca americana]XP_047119711.1 intraflagellar transport protein 52 homolog [Schistocerca piceifrons]XP_049939596.1 intraflagellar transport protein 52 homolog [Schistocerca serialis cubense]
MAPSEDLSTGVKDRSNNTILINSCKNELFKLTDNYRTLHRKLKGTWKVMLNKEEITDVALSDTSVFVLPGPREKFSEAEFNCMKKFLDSGGYMLVMLGEGGEKAFHTNINFLLEEYGIMVNNDCVIRTTYYKYFHPKECLITNGVINRSIAQASEKYSAYQDDYYSSQALSFIYPYGATLKLARPAVALLSTGSVAYPHQRPVCAVSGRLVVLGSGHMLADRYIDREDNDRIREVLLRLLSPPPFDLNDVDAEDPEIADYNMIPDTAKLAERPRVCLQESTDEIPMDYTKLFDQRLFSIHTGIVADAIEAYNQLNVKHEPLRLITPQFETPLPFLQAAVFPPSFRELPPPSLELFDLDEAFSSEQARLAQLANKCQLTAGETESEADVEYFIRECGYALGVDAPSPDARSILHAVGLQIAEFRKLGQPGE